VAERSQSQNCEPRADSTRRECLQLAHRPAEALLRVCFSSALISLGSAEFVVALDVRFAISDLLSVSNWPSSLPFGLRRSTC
jgi:hypothetical protein